MRATDFYNVVLAPAEKDLILKAVDYVAKYYDNYVCHMLPRIDDFMSRLK